MTSALRTLRSARRTSLLALTLVEIALRYGARRLAKGSPLTLLERGDWEHDSAKRILRRISIPVTAHGPVPNGGLIVSNHLSYLDVLPFAAVVPCAFVSKQEVRDWPFLGFLATLSNSIYVDRARGAQTVEAGSEIELTLAGGLAVVLYPEGTSTDGTAMLPFRPPLFEPAVRAGAPVTAAAIFYFVGDGPESCITFHGDDVFGPHLLMTLQHPGIRCEIHFAPVPRIYPDRKTAARESWAEVNAMRQRLSPEQTPAGELAFTQ